MLYKFCIVNFETNFFLLSQHPHKHAVSNLLATRCTKCNKAGPCHKFSFLPSSDCPNDMQTHQWNSLMSFPVYCTLISGKGIYLWALALFASYLLGWACFLVLPPIWDPLLDCSDSICLGPLSIISCFFFLCLFCVPLVTAPDWPSPKRTENKLTCVSEIGI